MPSDYRHGVVPGFLCSSSRLFPPMLATSTMHITAADWNLATGHAFEAKRERSERLKTWVGDRPADVPAGAPVAQAPAGPRASSSQVVVRDAAADLADRLQRQARQLQARSVMRQEEAKPTMPNGKQGDGDIGAAPDAKQEKILMLLERLFGIKRIARLDLSISSSQTATVQHVAASAAQERVGWGVEYDYHESYTETETLTLAAQGSFATDDGRSFSFSIDNRMERSFSQQTSLSVRAGDAVVQDPLVLDLAGTGIGFTQGAVPVDLDDDGIPDALPIPKPGNYFLVKGSAIPLSGADLFGPTTGQGFTELAAYDGDRNGFIDGADMVFSQLYLWDGMNAMLSLAESGVGAIAVDSVEAPFRHTDVANATLGLNRRSGLYLTEDGRAGMVHQVDVAV